MILKSYCKINVSLKIVDRRSDGYHDLESVFLPLTLHDIVEIKELKHGGQTYVTSSDLGDRHLEDNICKKAVDVMRRRFHFKQQFRIHIKKQIPFLAGLGGGSSNAWVVIEGLNNYLKLGASIDTLREIGLSLGADVPYFSSLKPCKVTGIGEILKEIKIKKRFYCILVKPDKGLSTKDVFKIADYFQKSPIDTDKVIEGMATGNDKEIASFLGNDLLKPALALLPEIGVIIHKIQDMGIELCSMSGSGSTVFALTSDKRLVKTVYKKLFAEGYNVFATEVLR